MIYLILAILSSVSVSLLMRFSEQKVKGNVSLLLMNYMMCIVLAVSFTGLGNGSAQPAGRGMAMGLGVINGCFYLASFVLFQYNVAKNGVVLSSTFMRLGVLVSMVLSIAVFGEKPEVLQIIGFIIAVGAIILIQTDKEKTTASFKAGLLILLLLNGSADAMSKVYDEVGNPFYEEYFLLFTFIFAGILCFALMLWKKERIGKAEMMYGVLIGIPNYFSARFLLKSLAHVPAVIAYPTNSVAVIVLISTGGVLFFKEKISRRQMAAMAAILASLVLLNI
ncbi:MAG: hypothetical protein E7253_00025 [Lachnospiraceae bacterium]|nr:hypothetical protein [Lachnospiraceae bacterium]